MMTAKLALKIPPVEAGTMGWWMAAFAGMAGAGLAGIAPVFLVLILLSGMDLLAGTWAAVKRREFRWARLLEGFFDKAFIWVIVGCLEIISRLLGIRLPLIPFNPTIGEAAAAWFALQHSTSVVANMARAGHSLPPWVARILARLTDKLNDLPVDRGPHKPDSEWPLLRDRER